MSRVITFSRVFPEHHPKAGQPTHFVEKIYNSLFSRNNLMDYPVGLDIDESILETKHHTIRQGRRWKEGMKFSPRVWSGKPYNSKQIIIAPDIEIVKTWDVKIECVGPDIMVLLPTESKSQFQMLSSGEVAKNDGLMLPDFRDWFNNNGKPSEFEGQIICWNKNVNY